MVDQEDTFYWYNICCALFSSAAFVSNMCGCRYILKTFDVNLCLYRVLCLDSINNHHQGIIISCPIIIVHICWAFMQKRPVIHLGLTTDLPFLFFSSFPLLFLFPYSLSSLFFHHFISFSFSHFPSPPFFIAIPFLPPFSLIP